MITIGHWSLWLLCPKKDIVSIIYTTDIHKVLELVFINSITHPITGFKDDSACVTTKTAGRIAEDGLVVLNITYMVYNIFHALTL